MPCNEVQLWLAVRRILICDYPVDGMCWWGWSSRESCASVVISNRFNGRGQYSSKHSKDTSYRYSRHSPLDCKEHIHNNLGLKLQYQFSVMHKTWRSENGVFHLALNVSFWQIMKSETFTCSRIERGICINLLKIETDLMFVFMNEKPLTSEY